MAVPDAHVDLEGLLAQIRTSGLSHAARKSWYPLLVRVALDGIQGALETPYGTIMAKYTQRFKQAIAQYEALVVRGEADALREEDEKVNVLTRLLLTKSLRALDQSHGEHNKLELQLVFPLICFTSAVVKKIDACFCILQDVLRNADWYGFTPTLLEHVARCNVFRELLKRTAPQTYTVLLSMGALMDEHLAHCFVGLFHTLLPTESAYRVLDCFFLEGEKILYRFGIALLLTHKADIKARTKFVSGEQFWMYLRSPEVAQAMNGARFDALSDLAFERNRSSMDKLLKPSCLSRKIIEQIKSQAKALVMSSKVFLESKGGDVFLSSILATRFRDGREVSSVCSKSAIVNNDRLAVRLLLCLNGCVSVVNDTLPLHLAFSTQRDGFELSTLYKRIGTNAPCILIIRSMRKKAVFGAFLPCPLLPLSNHSKGDTNAFVFRLDGDDASRFPPFSQSFVENEEGNAVEGSSPRYIVASKGYLLVGFSSSRSSNNAIRLEQDLSKAFSGPSMFGNETSLVAEEASPMAVDCIEVLSFGVPCAIDVVKEESVVEAAPSSFSSTSSAAAAVSPSPSSSSPSKAMTNLTKGQENTEEEEVIESSSSSKKKKKKQQQQQDDNGQQPTHQQHQQRHVSDAATRHAQGGEGGVSGSGLGGGRQAVDLETKRRQSEEKEKEEEEEEEKDEETLEECRRLERKAQQIKRRKKREQRELQLRKQQQEEQEEQEAAVAAAVAAAAKRVDQSKASLSPPPPPSSSSSSSPPFSAVAATSPPFSSSSLPPMPTTPSSASAPSSTPSTLTQATAVATAPPSASAPSASATKTTNLTPAEEELLRKANERRLERLLQKKKDEEEEAAAQTAQAAQVEAAAEAEELVAAAGDGEAQESVSMSEVFAHIQQPRMPPSVKLVGVERWNENSPFHADANKAKKGGGGGGTSSATLAFGAAAGAAAGVTAFTHTAAGGGGGGVGGDGNESSSSKTVTQMLGSKQLKEKDVFSKQNASNPAIRACLRSSLISIAVVESSSEEDCEDDVLDGDDDDGKGGGGGGGVGNGRGAHDKGQVASVQLEELAVLASPSSPHVASESARRIALDGLNSKNKETLFQEPSSPSSSPSPPLASPSPSTLQLKLQQQKPLVAANEDQFEF